MSTQHTINLFNDDFFKTLFPLDTNHFLINHFAEKISEFIYQGITYEKGGDYSFLTQEKVYASKKGLHLRRTVKLDVVAEFFIYDLVYRNRSVFRKSFNETRYSYGYRFSQGLPVSAIEEYKSFKLAIYENSKEYKYFAKFDIASFFNSIYHHDLIIWFNEIGRNEEDKLFFDKYLKQINGGRSIDCLPQGLIPTKIIGSNFLKFINNSSRIKSEKLIRFMDNFYIFSDSQDRLIDDFMFIQKLLGNKGLSLKESKTQITETKHLNIFVEIDDLKKRLLRRRKMMIVNYDSNTVTSENPKIEELTAEEKEYLYDLLRNDLIQEEDAELVLTLLRDESDEILEYLHDFLIKFPNLIKDIFFFTDSLNDKDSLKNVISNFLKTNKYATEYQLFWIAKIVERDFSNYPDFGELLILLYDHSNASKISQAKILEIPENKFSMNDLREEHLRTGESSWLSWSAAIGCRKMDKVNRNHLLSYFKNGSPMNKLIAECIMDYEE